MTRTKVPVLEAVRAAVRFAQVNVPKAAGALTLVMLLNIAGGMTGRAVYLAFAFGVLGLLAGVMANAALLRLAFAEEHPGDPEFRLGPFGLQWGRPELRLLGAVLLVMLFVVLAALLMVLLAIIVSVATLAANGVHAVAPDPAHLPPAAQVAVSLLILVFALAGLWVAVRICLYPAATVAEQRVQVFSTWKLTQGAFWPIFAAILLLLAPAFLLVLAIQAARALPAAQAALSVIFSAVGAFVIGPMITGLYAYLYGGLRSGGPAPALATPTSLKSDGLAGPWG